MPNETLVFQLSSWLRLQFRHHFPEALIVAVGLCVLLIGLICLAMHSYLPEGSWFTDPRLFTAACMAFTFCAVNLELQLEHWISRLADWP